MSDTAVASMPEPVDGKTFRETPNRSKPFGWITCSLTRKFVLGTVAGLLVTSIAFFFLFVWLYRSQLERQRSQASIEVNRLLQASLENAMLKRDLDGLRQIVDRLGAQEEIHSVMIVNPHNEVRFASNPDMLGRHFDSQQADACAVCHTANGIKQQATIFVKNEQGQEILRSVNPVSNKPICNQCHGPVADNPINGVLFVDYDAGPIRRQARTTAMLFVGSGILVVLVTLSGGSWFMRRFVLRPVNQLANASRALGKGKLDTRINPSGTDELALLGHEFDHMAARLQKTLHEVQEKEHFSQALIDADPDGIRVIDNNFHVVMANRTYREQLGLKEHEAIGANCYTSHGRQEPCPPTLETCPLHEIKNTGQPVKAVHRHIRANGDEFWVEIFAAPMQVKIKGEQHILIVESVRDLAKGVAYSHEQKLSTIGQLATGVAHEIQNPLASIRLALQNAERNITYEKDNVEEFREYLKLVDEQVDRSIDVTERLLKLSKFSGGTPTLVMVNPAVSETLSLLNYEAQEQGIVINMDLDTNKPRVIASDGDLRMLVLNLTQNAFHSMPDGGELKIRTEATKESVEIVFEDTGVGMTPTEQMHIFDPFYSHRADEVQGTGLGLSIVKAIVERHHGFIEVKSHVAQGSRFQIVFPSAEKQLTV